MKRCSPVLGCFGLALASFAGFFVVAALVDVAMGLTEDRSGPLCAGVMMLGLATVGALLMWRGFTKVADVPNPDLSAGIAMREAFLANAGPMDARSQRVNEAAGLMLHKRYVESGQAWEAIARDFPEERGQAYSQMGVACYFTGRYADAIAWYEQALQHGADPSMMKDNIDEARAALGVR
jgi:hypothetical protein